MNTVRANDLIRISAKPSLEPNVCQFIVDRTLLPLGSVSCLDPNEAKGSPLFEALFRIQGVKAVHVRENMVIISKMEEGNWKDLGSKIGSAIRELLISGKPLVDTNRFVVPQNQTATSQGCGDHCGCHSEKAPSDVKAIRDTIERILQTQINPSVAAHGGKVRLVDVSEGRVYLEFGGGCQGCGMSSVTLRQGVEQTIRRAVPSISEVIDATDHAKGKTPYYASSR